MYYRHVLLVGVASSFDKASFPGEPLLMCCRPCHPAGIQTLVAITLNRVEQLSVSMHSLGSRDLYFCTCVTRWHLDAALHRYKGDCIHLLTCTSVIRRAMPIAGVSQYSKQWSALLL